MRLAQRGLFVWWAEDLLHHLRQKKPSAPRDEALKEKLAGLARRLAQEIKEGRGQLEGLLWVLLSDFFWMVQLGTEVDLAREVEGRGRELWPRLAALCGHYLGKEAPARRFRLFIEERLIKAPRPGQDPTGGKFLPLEFRE